MSRVSARVSSTSNVALPSVIPETHLYNTRREDNRASRIQRKEPAMFSSRNSIATLAVLALTSAGGAVTSTPATATSPRSDYCTNSGSTHLPQSADTAATWLAACPAGDQAVGKDHRTTAPTPTCLTSRARPMPSPSGSVPVMSSSAEVRAPLAWVRRVETRRHALGVGSPEMKLRGRAAAQNALTPALPGRRRSA